MPQPGKFSGDDKDIIEDVACSYSRSKTQVIFHTCVIGSQVWSICSDPEGKILRLVFRSSPRDCARRGTSIQTTTTDNSKFPVSLDPT